MALILNTISCRYKFQDKCYSSVAPKCFKWNERKRRKKGFPSNDELYKWHLTLSKFKQQNKETIHLQNIIADYLPSSIYKTYCYMLTWTNDSKFAFLVEDCRSWSSHGSLIIIVHALLQAFIQLCFLFYFSQIELMI